jgi:hypothetical protein
MDLVKTGVNVGFYQGNHDSSHKDQNGFWLTIGTYDYTIDIENNRTTIDISGISLVASTANKFTNYTLKVYLRAEYFLNGNSQTKYFFGDADGTSVGQKSMTGTSLSLLTTSQIAPVVIPHNEDGTRPDLIIRAYCTGVTGGSNDDNIPDDTEAYSFPFSLVRIPRGPRVKDSGVWRNTILYVKDNGTWKIAIPYVKDNGTWKIGGG